MWKRRAKATTRKKAKIYIEKVTENNVSVLIQAELSSHNLNTIPPLRLLLLQQLL